MEFWEAGSWVDLTHTLHTRGQRNTIAQKDLLETRALKSLLPFYAFIHLSLPSTATRTPPPSLTTSYCFSPSHTARLIENLIILHLSIVSFPQEVYLPHLTSSLACHTLILHAAASSLQSECNMPCSELFNGSCENFNFIEQVKLWLCLPAPLAAFPASLPSPVVQPNSDVHGCVLSHGMLFLFELCIQVPPPYPSSISYQCSLELISWPCLESVFKYPKRALSV